MIVPPPIPAPYLDGVPQMPDDLLKAMHSRRRMTFDEQRRADHILRQLRKRIFVERAAYEGREGIRIQPEQPMVP